MNDPVQNFLSCCQLVLQGDAVLLEELRAQGFVCAAGRWDFSLPALHAYLSGEGAVDYRHWLQRLYASDINARLREQGAAIVILDNRGKVDLSLYGLRRLPLNGVD
ncbi:hypothetical protein [Pseudomonas sp.]|uniref:hypothetical protein n=1 Tax=Pseudomonas sp. TaxID=306 RepID=UPI0027370EA2|nr:hypothetical protein [Pseudomonas sp.]MDP3815648.1 hypothetical protein [Pseudomonas sp.]